MRRFAGYVLLSACALSILAFSLSAADRQPPPWEKNRLASGLALYRTNCVVCHDIDRPATESKKLGPSFYQLFRQDKMPLSGVKPTRDYIKTVMQAGFPPIMPSFAGTLNDSEIDLLLDYIQSK
jgi:mono/diheme cytochrome c family protein